jgi:HD-GYP domain-containing protein (c-di-GMP phosphodiesterase class II)
VTFLSTQSQSNHDHNNYTQPKQPIFSLKFEDYFKQISLGLEKPLEPGKGHQSNASVHEIAKQYHDVETHNHTMRIGQYSALLAQQIGWSKKQCNAIAKAAPFHDIGKTMIPTRILNKNEALTDAEKLVMNDHTIYGYEILMKHHSIAEPHIQLAAEIALYHHEKWDGSGYPRKLSGEEIPLSARIVSLVDCYDALRSERSYKLGYSHTDSLSILVDGNRRTSPLHFDPQLLLAFYNNHSAFEAVFDSFEPTSQK